MMKKVSWSEEEMAILRSGLSVRELVIRLENRTEKAVREKMRSLQIQGFDVRVRKIPVDAFDRWKKWSEEEDQFLKNNLSSKSLEEMALFLNRTKAAVHKRVLQVAKGSGLSPFYVSFWRQDDDDFLRANYGRLKAKVIAEKLNRTEVAVRSRASFLGLKSFLKRQPWTVEQIQILKEEFIGEKTVINSLARKLMKSPGAIRQKANNLGLCRTIRSKNTEKYRSWSVEEIDILKDVAGEVPLILVVKKINNYCKKEGLSQRSYNAVRLKAMELKIDYFCDGDGDYFSVSNLTEALNTNQFLVGQWVKKYKDILRPVTTSENEKATVYIPRSNFRKFVLKYPGEIARTRPDILWLISLFDK